MKRVIIDAKDEIIKTALTENGELVEVIPSIPSASYNAGDIYIGRIMRILKSGFAFINLGNEKNVFLYYKDNKEFSLWENDRLKIKSGQEIIVQITKYAEENKRAAVTTALSLSGAYAVLMLGKGEIRISRKINDTKRREELKELLRSLGLSHYDIILRTKAETAENSKIKEDTEKLKADLESIIAKGKHQKSPACLYKSPVRALSAIAAFAADEEVEIVTNNLQNYRTYIDPEGIFTPKVHTSETPVFREYFIEDKLKKALKPKVWLKSGGWIIIESAEAMTVIDVNTGKNNTKDHETAVFKTNMEAAEEILKQLRLRNISGIILADFINMADKSHKADLLSFLTEKAKKDPVSVSVAGITNLGLIELTRKKVGIPLKQCFAKPCPNCGGTGTIINI